jgi:glutathione S-transferase
MSEEVIFYHNPRSRAQMVHWMLEELGAPYQIRPIDFEKGDNRTPEFLAINPMGKLPTIIHRGVTVTETAAIIAYLADAFPSAGLAPAIDDPKRGTWLRWIVFGASCFEPALLDTMMKRPETPKMSSGYGSYEDVLHALEVMLEPGPWILGEAFSAADVYIGSELAWGASFGAPGILDRPKLAAYIERVKARPAHQRTTS